MAGNCVNTILDLFSLSLVGILAVLTWRRRERTGFDRLFRLVLLLQALSAGADLVFRRAGWLALLSLTAVLGLAGFSVVRRPLGRGMVGRALLTGLPVLLLIGLALAGGPPPLLIYTASVCLLVVEQDEQYDRIQRDGAERRIRLMLSQLQPHFLYNTLSAIRSLCRREPERAWKALGDFAVYLRGNMDALTSGRVVHFSAELAHIETYLRLEQLRLGDRLRVVYRIEETDFVLPGLTVQPLVENAVKHGIFGARDGGTVTLSTRREGEQICITVADDGIGFTPEAPPEWEGTGLRDVRDRLKQFANGRLTLESEPGRGTRAVIFLNTEKGASEHVCTGS